jgi:hypothetical protein
METGSELSKVQSHKTSLTTDRGNLHSSENPP